jgi:tight adherence protein C
MPTSLSSLLAVRVGQFHFSPFETVILVVTFAVALVSLFRLWLIAQRERRQPRLEAMRIAAADPTAEARPPRQTWYGWLGAAVAATPIVGRGDQQRMLDLLSRAGFRQHGALAAMVASKLCGGVGFAALAWLFLEWRGLLVGSTLFRSIVAVAALLIGWRLPDFILGRLAARRRTRIEHGMPDALDLLVVCAEAGLSLDQSIEQVSRELQFSHPEIAEEFATTVADMRMGSERGAALQNLVQRTHLEILRSITATLTQAIRFGTPLAESLRVLAAEMRTFRLLRIEERAARLPVLLTIPLLTCIMPALMIVIMTPVALRIADFFAHVQIGRGTL